MKNYFTFLTAIAIMGSVTSCKKEQLPELPEPNGPYYHISGLVNEDSINWKVGVNDTWITYGQSSVNGVESFYGQITSGSSGDAIRIDVLRPEIFSDGTSISAFTDANLTYLVHQSGAVKFNFGVNYEQFNYVLVKNELDLFEQVNEVEFDEFGIYNVSLKFLDYSLSESYSVPVKYGFQDVLLNTGFTSHGQADTLILEPLTFEGDHEWYIDGDLVSTDPTFSIALSDGIYEVNHVFTDIHGNEGNYATLIRFKDGEFYWQMKYFYVPPSQPSSHYGDVIVSMKKNNIWYTSIDAEENLGNKFVVSNIVTEINLSEDNGRTAFDFVFRSMLYTPDQMDSLYLPEMTGRMAIEFK